VNQFSVVENKHSRRPDVALFINGLPLAIVELKNAADENTTAGDEKAAIKVVMTGDASEGPRVSEHARNKPRHEALAKRFRDQSDPFKLVIVGDMWLTGFDAPSMHTMYVDKPMRGHGLIQAIARVKPCVPQQAGVA